MGVIPTTKDTNKIVHYVTVGGLKLLEEKVTAPYIGNASLKSGLIKAVAGGLLPESGIAGSLKEVLLIDGAEDIASELIGIVFGGFAQSESVNYI
jgi:hypothetical protein